MPGQLEGFFYAPLAIQVWVWLQPDFFIFFQSRLNSSEADVHERSVESSAIHLNLVTDIFGLSDGGEEEILVCPILF